MVLTDHHTLPNDEELTVQELTISSPFLRATANYMGYYCDDKCKEFMLCRTEEKDPRKCIGEGKEVTACGLEFLQKVKKHCAAELTNFAKCLEWSSSEMTPEYCRKEQKIYDACIEERIGPNMKPRFGYFAQMRLHEPVNGRPKPIPYVPEFPDPTKGLDTSREPLKPSMHGIRAPFKE